MVKDLSLTFQQCLGAFSLLLFEGCLKTGLLGIDPTRFFASVISEIHQLRGSSIFKKSSKFKPDLKKAQKNQKKFFVFEIIASQFVALNCLY